MNSDGKGLSSNRDVRADTLNSAKSSAFFKGQMQMSLGKERLSKHYRKSILSESQRNQIKIANRETKNSRRSSRSNTSSFLTSKSASVVLNTEFTGDKKVNPSLTIDHAFSVPKSQTLIGSRNKLLSNHTHDDGKTKELHD